MILVQNIAKISCLALSLAAFFFLNACDSDDQNDEAPVVSAYGQNLFQSDIDGMIPDDLSETEKAALEEEIINNWIQQQVVLNKVNNDISDVSKKIEQRIEKYRTDLLLFEFEKQAINNRLDTIVSEKEITNYYKNNIKEFELDDYLVQAIFVKAPKSAPDIDKVNFWFRSKDSTDMVKLKEWSSLNAVNFYYDDESWLYYNEIQKMLPQEMVLNSGYFILNKLARKYESEDFVYFFRVLDFRTGISPLEFEKENIKTRIIQMRITTLREELREEIINDAFDNNQVKRY